MKSMFMQMVIEHMHNRRYAKRSIELYSKWIISFIRFNNNRHPSEMGDKEVEVFLSHLVNAKNVAPATQASALNALAFLYRDILELKTSILTTTLFAFGMGKAVSIAL